MPYAKATDVEKKQYNNALGELEKYPGGKLSTGKFSNLFGPIAREENRKSGIPASVTLAQAALETGWGKSSIGSAKNLFGIKGTGPAGTTVVSTQECANGQYYTIKAGFKKYNTWMESVEDHTKVLQLSRYKNCYKYSNDPDQFAREVHKGGYATAHNYADTLISIMRSNNLYKWDLKTSGGASQAGSEAVTGGSSHSGTTSGRVSAGAKVRVTGSRYATGQSIPSWVKNNTYTVQQVSGDRVLLKEIMSWVKISDVEVQGGSKPASKPAEKTPSKSDSSSKGADKSTQTPLEELLAKNPGVRTNQDLINLFYSLGGGTFNGAAAAATQYGVNINTLCSNRGKKISGAGGGSAPEQQKPKPKPETPKTPYQELLANHPEVKTNQDLINLFYSLGGGTFNGAANAAKKYGVNINTLCSNRNARVSQSSGGSTTGGSSTGGSSSKPKTPYQQLLASHPEVKTNQDLINLFYSLGGGSYGGAANAARKYGVNLDSLCSNRNASVNGTAGGGSTGGGSTGGGAVSTNGVPLFRQGDSRWGGRGLGTGGNTIRSAGCAMCSTAMAISKFAGRVIQPDELDRYLDNHGGYDGDCIYWGVAARYVGCRFSLNNYTKSGCDEQLNNGKAFVISVRNQGHWVCVAGRNSDGTYIIHDPGDGTVRSGYWNGSYIKVNGYTAGSQIRKFY